MPRQDFESVKLRRTTRDSVKAAARKYRTSMTTVVEAAMQRFEKLPQKTIVADIERHDPRSGPLPVEVAAGAASAA